MIIHSLNRLMKLLEIIPPLLSEIPEEDFSLKINVNKWSKKEIVGHLIDSASNNHQRFIRTQCENIPTIFYDQDNWNRLNHYHHLPGTHIIHFWTTYNQHLLEIIKRIPQEDLLKQCNVGNNKIVTLQYLIDDYVQHVEHHLKQFLMYV